MASPKQKRTPLARSDRPDYDYLDGLTLAIYPCSNPEPAPREVVVTTPTGKRAVFTVERKDGECVIRSFDVVHGRLVLSAVTARRPQQGK